MSTTARQTICGLSVIGLAIALQSCAITSPPIELPVSDRPAAAAGDATDGRIALEGGCVVLAGQDGSKFNLLWPAGYVASGPPLAINSPNGETVMHGGDRVVLGVEDLGVRDVRGCPTRPTWAIGEIVEVNGEAPPGTVVPQPTRIPQPPR